MTYKLVLTVLPLQLLQKFTTRTKQTNFHIFMGAVTAYSEEESKSLIITFYNFTRLEIIVKA
jgi:hypothetical protein